ncbi:hypothetical protein GCM10011490_21210 [Pseudoclavibacter endophyticus]|nr:hypothetical protein GCM10011490_21210 [Pseudoclavibacter endophyticus]
MDWVKDFVTWYNATRFARTMKENFDKGAPVMAGGMAFMGIFSLFAGLWAVFSVLGLVVAGREDIQMWVITSIDTALPGLIGTGAAIDPDVLLNATVFGWTGIIALVGTVWTALRWLGGTRIAIRSIFELAPTGDIPFVLAKLRDLGLIIAALVLLLLSSSFIAGGQGAVTWAMETFGLADLGGAREVLIQISSSIIAVIFDSVLLAGLVRVLAHLHVPWRVLAPAALVGGVILGVIKMLAASLVGGASANPLLATFATLVSVLILFNLMATVQLLVATWVKVSMDDLGLSPRMLTAEEAAEEARATAIRAQQELLAAEELALREELRTSHRFGDRAAKRRLREIEDERRTLENEDLVLRMWNGDRPASVRATHVPRD